MSINKITDCHPGLYDKIVEYDPSHNNFKINAQIETQETLTADECKLAFKEPVVVKSIFEEKAWQDFSDIWTTVRTFSSENYFRQVPFPLSNKKIALSYTSFLKDENGKEKVVNFTKGKLNINIPNIIKRICLYKVNTTQNAHYTAYVETLPVETLVVDDQLQDSSLKSNSCLIAIPQSYEEPQVANSSTLFSKNYGQQDFEYIKQELKIAQDKKITDNVYFTKTFIFPKGFSPVTEFDTGGNIEEIYYYFDYSNSSFEVSPQESGRESQYDLQGNKLVANNKGYSFSFEGQYSDNIAALLSSKVYYWQFSHLLYSKNDWQPFYLIRERQIRNNGTISPSQVISNWTEPKIINWTIDTELTHYDYKTLSEEAILTGYNQNPVDYLKITDLTSTQPGTIVHGAPVDLEGFLGVKKILYIDNSSYNWNSKFLVNINPLKDISVAYHGGRTFHSEGKQIVQWGGFPQSGIYSSPSNLDYEFQYSIGSWKLEKQTFNTDLNVYTFVQLDQQNSDTPQVITIHGIPKYETSQGIIYLNSDNRIEYVDFTKNDATKDILNLPDGNYIVPSNFLNISQGKKDIRFKNNSKYSFEKNAFNSSLIENISINDLNAWVAATPSKLSGNLNYSLTLGQEKLTTLHIYDDLPENAFYGCNSIKNIYIHKTGLALGANSLQLTTTERVQVYYNGEKEDLLSAFGAFINYDEPHKMTVLEQPNFEKTFSFTIENDTSLDPMQYWYYTIENNISEDKNNPNWIELYKSDLLYTNIMQFSYRYFLPNEGYRITAYARFKSGIEKELSIIENRIIESEPISINLPQEIDVSNQLIEEIDAGALFPSQGLFPSQDLYPELFGKFNSYENVVILRQDKDTGRSVIIFEGSGANISGLRDYSILNNKTYQYWFYCFNTLENNSIALQTYKSNEIKTHFDEWVLMEVEESRDSNNNIQEGIYKCRNQYAFAMNISSGTINNGNTPSTSIAAGRYPTIQMDTSNYWQGTLSALLGMMSSTIRYDQTVAMEEEFRNLSNSSYKKFLKDKDGHIWEVELSAAPTLEAKENVWVNGVYKTLRSKQLNWVQTGSADYISIINK